MYDSALLLYPMVTDDMFFEIVVKSKELLFPILKVRSIEVHFQKATIKYDNMPHLGKNKIVY